MQKFFYAASMAFWLGIIGSLILVTGAAWPDRKNVHPMESAKDWLFALGGGVMLLYAIVNWQAGGPIFFVFLEALVGLASVFMMLGTRDTIDTPIIVLAALALIVWSLYLFEGYDTVVFILGLCGIGIGYAMDAGTLKREFALMLGSILIAVFSYIEASWIFFWLNTFFALFSGWYTVKMMKA